MFRFSTVSFRVAIIAVCLALESCWVLYAACGGLCCDSHVYTCSQYVGEEDQKAFVTTCTIGGCNGLVPSKCKGDIVQRRITAYEIIYCGPTGGPGKMDCYSPVQEPNVCVEKANCPAGADCNNGVGGYHCPDEAPGTWVADMVVYDNVATGAQCYNE